MLNGLNGGGVCFYLRSNLLSLKQRSFLKTFVKDHGTTLGNSQILTTCGNSGKNQLLACIDKHAP
ncbi:unnamed protein product [Porites evermanni]|uniref:Uncharacterized protein n=1 Tax=Porites evermanni TaxID=104178 RepID=A0ABN8MJ11_9CNID|nr:unnamed protein product [Porites evermanni]CAH3194070.1 unnamed protein product [Porites evermanni]